MNFFIIFFRMLALSEHAWKSKITQTEPLKCSYDERNNLTRLKVLCLKGGKRIKIWIFKCSNFGLALPVRIFGLY